MIKQLRFSLALALLFAFQHTAIATTDPRFVRISKDELRQAIATIPISSSQHAVITARADASRLQREAYEGYTTIWRKNQQDANANLRRGIAGFDYWMRVSSLPQQQAGVTVQQEIDLYTTTRQCLAEAVRLNPRSVDALVAYGFFSWQFDNRMDEGLAMVKKAMRISPGSARAHYSLGSIYSNPSGNAYNPQKAEQELELVARLNPTWASPRWDLMLLYINTNRFKAAQAALNSYLNVVPMFMRKSNSVEEMRIAINKGLTT